MGQRRPISAATLDPPSRKPSRRVYYTAAGKMFQARLKPLGGRWHTERLQPPDPELNPFADEDKAAFRAVCGRPVACTGLIGHAHRTVDGWVLRHPHGYGQPDKSGAYRPGLFITGKTRRSLPDGIRSSSPHITVRTFGRKRYVGLVSQLPTLPATIYCPVCRLPNRVELPLDTTATLT